MEISLSDPWVQWAIGIIVLLVILAVLRFLLGLAARLAAMGCGLIILFALGWAIWNLLAAQ